MALKEQNMDVWRKPNPDFDLLLQLEHVTKVEVRIQHTPLLWGI